MLWRAEHHQAQDTNIWLKQEVKLDANYSGDYRFVIEATVANGRQVGRSFGYNFASAAAFNVIFVYPEMKSMYRNMFYKKFLISKVHLMFYGKIIGNGNGTTT